MRHYLNLGIIYSLFTEFRTVGPYDLNWETGQYKCLLSNVLIFGMLASLQALNLFWLYCLLRSAYRFVVHNIAKDDRSETDTEPEELEHAVETKKVDAPSLLESSNGVPSARGVITASGNSIASTPMTRKSSRTRAR